MTFNELMNAAYRVADHYQVDVDAVILMLSEDRLSMLRAGQQYHTIEYNHLTEQYRINGFPVAVVRGFDVCEVVVRYAPTLTPRMGQHNANPEL